MSTPITLIDKPITLFDKSFLPSLGVDESVWFDNFFRANVCPLFYVETLADLDKVPKGLTPEQDVRGIARKFPHNGSPNLYHGQLALDELMGKPVPMIGQIILPHGKLAKSGNDVIAVIEPSPEEKAFERWQQNEFLEFEHSYARVWRQAISSLDLEQGAKELKAQGVDNKSCRDLQTAKALAESLFSTTTDTKDFKRVLRLVGVPQEKRNPVIKRWKRSGCLQLNRYAPYTLHVVNVLLFFRIAMAANLIGTSRSSNFVDIAYLFYLPFCQIFVSKDNLHKRIAPLFVRKDQEFVSAEDLKRGLGELNEYYAQFPEEMEKQGVMSLVHPPDDRSFFVTQLWDRHIPTWRERAAFTKTMTPEDLDEFNEYIKGFVVKKIRDAEKSPPVAVGAMSEDGGDPGFILRKYRVRVKKGSWRQVPKSLKPPKA